MKDVGWKNIKDVKYTYAFKVSYLLINMLAHIFNLYSDYCYMEETPMYSGFIKGMMYFFWYLPFLLALLYYGFDMHKSGCADPMVKANVIIPGLIGATDLIEFLRMGSVNYEDELKIKKEFAYMILQDIP